MRPSLRLCLLLLGWAAFRPPTAHAQCNPAGTTVTLDYGTRAAGEDWRNRANAGVPTATSFTQASTTYTTSDNSSTLVTGTLNGTTLVWTATEPNKNATTNSTVTYTFSRPVSNLSVRVRDIDANFVAAGFLTNSHGFNDEVTFTGANGTGGATIYPTLTKANTASTFVSITGTNRNVAVGSETAGNTDSPVDGTVTATFAVPITSLTLVYRNVTTATNLDQQAVGIDRIAWCRITPTATTPLTTAAIPSSSPQTSITGLSGTADGTPSFFVNLPTYGTLFYNSTGTTYVPVSATTGLTPAQAASLRYTPDPNYTGSSTSFTYQVRDDAGLVSPVASYTIPLQYIAPCATATNTFDFTTRPTNEDWKAHAAVNAPAASTLTTISSGNYSNSPASTSTLQIGSINNPATSLVWTNQYSSATPGVDRTSSVTFTFSRAVSNFTVQVQDIDVNNATGSTFVDQVVFSGLNGSATVTPTLTAMNPANGSVTISGNTASGRNYNATNGVDGTVTAYFPSPITSLTLTYNNASQGTNINTTQAVGIDNMTWCRTAPTALPVTTTTVPSTATQVGIASLNGSADGTVASYTLTSLPTNGTVFYNSTGTTYVPVTTSTVLTPAQAASLRYTPNASFTGTSTSFTYQVRDDAGIVSANTATYTIPLANTACTTATASLNFGTTTPVPDDWRAHAAVAVPAGSTQTSVSTGNYTTPATVTTSTLMTVASTANGGGNQSNLNGVQTLVWYTDYANTTDNTSTVTYTFTRPVSNFAVRVQDIDRVEDGTNAFIDQVTFAGLNGTTAVTPVLGPASANNANTVIINGNVATGTTNITNTTDGTVVAYFAGPITSLTLTYRNLSTAQSSQGQGNPSANAVGIDLLSFCRLAPVANPVTIASLSDGTGQTAISPLSSTVDGTVASYRLTSIPTAAQGVLYVNGVAATANQVLTPLQATQLSFDPAVGASNPVTFAYTVTDDATQQSTAATYTIPVNATGAAGPAAPCATPGKDLSPVALTTNPNTYFPSSASQTLMAGATSIVVGAATGTLTNITAGDLLLVIQMQGADINSTNSDSYGDGVAGGGASGNLTTNFTAGTYEYVVASNTVTAATGGTINLVNGLRNSYVNAAATTTTGQRTFQVIRVPQYAALTLGGNLTATPWNGSTGGIIVLDVAGVMNFAGFTINASGAGFRGGAGRRLGGSNTVVNTDYRYPATTAVGAQKGEGIAGTPQYVNNNGALLDTGTDGYPNGSSSRGAPGNAGGGGSDGSPANNAQNSGGGGGANGGAGGRGGNTWNTNLAIGGEPGAAFTVASSSRLILGGGGGAGSTNDGTGNTARDGFASSGSAGGGLVIVRTGSVGTSGSIVANGADANTTVTTDGGGGAGAGGSILLTATSPATLANVNLSAIGGKGAITTPAANDYHGGGGGGGGGVIFTDGGTASATMTGGANGTTVGTTGIAFGATPGTAGLSNAQISNSIANSATGANCFADVATTITGPASVNAGQPTDNFTATFANIGSNTAQSVSQTITLPAGAGLTTAQRAAIVAAYPAATFSAVGTNPTTINFGTLTSLAPNASNSYSFAYTAPAALGTATTRSSTGTTSLENGQTANNISDFATTVVAAADVTVALKGPTTLNAGQPTGTFTATFTNEGPNAAASVTRMVTLPAGAVLTATQLTLLRTTYPSATYSSATNTIDFGSLTSLASDASSTVSFSFTAPTALGSSTLTGNTSTSSAEGNNSAPNQTTLALNTVATADVAATITASSTATTGTFSVTFTNNGPQTAAGVVRTVQLPAGLTGVTFSGDAASYDATTGLVTYSASPVTIAAGSSLNSTISYALTSSTAPVAATATVGTTTNEAGQTANNTATALMPATFDLATTLTGPSTAIAGSPTKLYVTTTNNGPNGAPSATQSVIIPSAAPLTNVYITNGGTYTYNTTTGLGTVTFPSVANLPAGQTVTNSISFNAPSSSFAPSAVVDAASGDTDATNNTAYLNANASSTSVAVAAATANQTNEATTITADATIVNAGSVVTYTVTATNKGYLNTPSVTNVAEQVQLLPGLTATTLTVGGVTGTQVDNLIQYTTAAGTTTYDPATGIVTYPVLATQVSGTTFTFDKLAVTVPANAGNNGQLLATATVSTDLSDPTPADNTSSVVVKVQTTADLAATLTGTTTATAGQTASYTATFVNRGAGSATNVVETVQLPAGLSNVLVQDASGNVINNAYNAATGLVTIPATPATTNMVAGSSQVYGISFTAPAQSFPLTSTISSGTTDNATTNNSALLRTTVSPTADVAVYVSGPATAVAGNAVTYAVTYANNGPDAASAVQATLQLPAGLTGSGTVVTNADGSSNNGVVLTGGGTYNATTGLVTFPSVNLAAGDSRVGLVTFTMPASPTGGQISGNASVTTTSTDVIASNNTAAITTDVAPATTDQADLITSIVAPASPAPAGSAISYTLNFRNSSATTAAIKVMPTAYLPAGLSNVVVRDASNNIVPNAYNSATGQIVLPTIDSQAPGNLTTYTVSLTAPANATAISASSVSSNTSDPNPGNNVQGSVLNITPVYDVVTSLSGPTSAQPGSVNTYTLTTTNNGPSTSSATAGSTTQSVTVPIGSIVGGVPANAYNSSTGVITFPAISSQGAGANGAVSNTFTVQMPATGSLALTAAITASGESNTTNNQAALTTAPANQAPVAQNVWNTLQNARGNTAPNGLLISQLNATDADGSVSSYTVTTLPPATQGVLYLANGSAVVAGQSVPANGLYFAPNPSFIGNATFTYSATDNGSATSNRALYTIPVAADQNSAYTTYNSGKGTYATGEVLAQAIDPNAAIYNGSGAMYTTTGVLQPGASNGLANAVIASGTLPTGVSIDPATGRIYVSDPSALPKLTQTTSYSLQVTTTDANGGTSTVPVTFAIGATPLPVTLVEFTAQAVANRNALLSWSTASEKNNDHFEVERSFDGTSFTKIGQVAGHGTTAAASTYSFTDAGVATQATGPVYYRLRQVDLDGTATYSPQRTVSFTKVMLAKLALFPNPVQSRTTLDLSALAATTPVQAQLLDATGRQVRTWTLLGGVAQPLELADLASGSYLLVVTGQQPDGSVLKQTLRLTKE